MARYAALLRGINVGGRAKVAMADLRAVFEAMGYRDVATYIQSGNVVFDAPGSGAGSVDVGALRARIAADLGVEAEVLCRSAEELAAVAAANPFARRDPSTLHVTFLAAVPEADLPVPPGIPDEAVVVGREVYLCCPDGYGRTKLDNTYVEKKLGVRATTRNWKTVLTLTDMTGSGPQITDHRA